MKIYGYENEDSDLVSLEEMSLQVTIEELRELSNFIINTINIMEESGENFEHEHFSDFIKSKKSPDIIITK
ncbi:MULTISPECIES: hypothetical protein [unclassified Pantoea]|uniref:hypothetical protein n=1 Tax=unclassified Pantoea TaxID=2630326 RepID=UPI0024776177|nr:MULTISPECIES: hypothetical protein [unclassified Pantoea]GME48144.1 hypothetical protein ACJ3_44850 [Pantoea sp. QMID3]GME48315.1 hypothetical protein ACJ1_44660 [Pantoea sp. QMID1]GME62937.1 hypothetical protein ACJ4_44720 [Pantoea sp. QMID4]GME64045.1 hypothetical protein ACJ2_44850 [Pantoea sp. QMID2]